MRTAAFYLGTVILSCQDFAREIVFKKNFGSLRSAQANANNPLNPLIALNPVMKQHYVMLRALAFKPRLQCTDLTEDLHDL